MRTWAALAALATLSACEPQVALPLGPPGCEPVAELALERTLKAGYRALAEGDPKAAAARFAEAATAAPGHPEALLGARLSAGRSILRSNEPPRESQRGAIEIFGEAIPVDLDIERGRLRFEELATLAPLRRAREPSHPVFDYFRPRPDAADRKSLDRAIDLIVLHDTHTLTARESFVELESQGGSTHFIIDWDGTIHQTLDLGLEANHTRIAPQDARSIAIDLVNPVDATRLQPLPDLTPAQVRNASLARPMGEPRVLQGEEVQHWGYTQAQLDSLTQLVQRLSRILPDLPLAVPRAKDGIPRRVLSDVDGARGIVGHLHLSPRAKDPGGAFPWEDFAQALGRP